MVAKNVQQRGTLKTMRQVLLPEVLKRARGAHSLREMARRTGLAVNAIKSLEDGDTAVPKRETLTVLADAYEIDPEVIAKATYGLYFEDSSQPDSPANKEAVAV